MVCIHCGQDTQVINSRPQKRLNQIWRRRKCPEGHIYTTLETADYEAVWRVREQNRTLTPYSRDILFLSLLKALEHRKTAVADAGALADAITAKLTAPGHDAVIPVSQIISNTQVVLNRFDKVASVLYQAHHK